MSGLLPAFGDESNADLSDQTLRSDLHTICKKRTPLEVHRDGHEHALGTACKRRRHKPQHQRKTRATLSACGSAGIDFALIYRCADNSNENEISGKALLMCVLLVKYGHMWYLYATRQPRRWESDFVQNENAEWKQRSRVAKVQHLVGEDRSSASVSVRRAFRTI